MYEGIFEHNKPKVLKSGYEFSPDESLKYKSLYPMFSWGNTKGSLQLAFAILLEEYTDDFADGNYIDFHKRVISKLDATKDFKLTRKEIEFWRKNPK